MDLSSEFETMAEIERMLENSKFKNKLQKNEKIDPEEFLNDSIIEDTQGSNMRSLYLTEPISIHLHPKSKALSNTAEESEGEFIISNEAEIMNLEMGEMLNEDHKSNIFPSAKVFVDIKKTKRTERPANCYNIQKANSSEYFTSDFIK